MRIVIDLPEKLEKQLTAYRDAKRAKGGKLPFRATAVLELLALALDGVKPELPIVDRLAALEARVDALFEMTEIVD